MRLNRIAAAAIAVLAPLTFTAAAHAAESDVDAAARPAFESPFPCKQSWRASTYTGHRLPYAIDFNLASGGDTDAGRSVRASAAGTATVRYAASGYGNYVIINHGGGWTSLYAHLGKVSIKNGQKVARGVQIGTVGKSGGQKYTHLHYEQRLNNNDVKAVIHGTPVKYYGKTTIVSHNAC